MTKGNNKEVITKESNPGKDSDSDKTTAMKTPSAYKGSDPNEVAGNGIPREYGQ